MLGRARFVKISFDEAWVNEHAENFAVFSKPICGFTTCPTESPTALSDASWFQGGLPSPSPQQSCPVGREEIEFINACRIDAIHRGRCDARPISVHASYSSLSTTKCCSVCRRVKDCSVIHYGDQRRRDLRRATAADERVQSPVHHVGSGGSAERRRDQRQVGRADRPIAVDTAKVGIRHSARTETRLQCDNICHAARIVSVQVCDETVGVLAVAC